MSSIQKEKEAYLLKLSQENGMKDPETIYEFHWYNLYIISELERIKKNLFTSPFPTFPMTIDNVPSL